jgi:hypothetical protein
MADAEELLEQARRGAERALGELDRAAHDLAQPWPRVEPAVVREGQAAVERASAALRGVLDRLDENPKP